MIEFNQECKGSFLINGDRLKVETKIKRLKISLYADVIERRGFQDNYCLFFVNSICKKNIFKNSKIRIIQLQFVLSSFHFILSERSIMQFYVIFVKCMRYFCTSQRFPLLL